MSGGQYVVQLQQRDEGNKPHVFSWLGYRLRVELVEAVGILRFSKILLCESLGVKYVKEVAFGSV